ncbi:MAG: amylo-alpha-1,6-glucosidase [Nitrospirae bacterium]|nr:amylo-alpha-1,6-glucosidase [Nitrospirota bacterium]
MDRRTHPYEIHPLLVLDATDSIFKADDHFAIWPPSGDVESERISYHGFFWHGMRYLSRWSVRLFGIQPVPLWAQGRKNPHFEKIHRIMPILTFQAPGERYGQVLRLSMSQTRVLEADGFSEKCSVENRSPHPVTVPMEWLVGADFTDLFEIRGMPREAPAPRVIEWLMPDPGLSLYRYQGADGLMRETSVRLIAPAEGKADRSGWSWTLDLGPEENATFFVRTRFREIRGRTRISMSGSIKKVPDIEGVIARRQRETEDFSAFWPKIRSSDPFLDRCCRQAVEDLRVLCTPVREGLIPYAGLPWFSTVFGRDALITGLSTLWAVPELSRTILLFLGRLQARVLDPKRAAEPGKIVHEMRTGEMAGTGEVPFGLYYGSVDSTPLYLMLAARYVERTGDYPFLEKLWPVIERAFSWIERYGMDPETGFLVYRGDMDGGLIQQGWKDSGDSVFHADGRLAAHPVALCEVQSYLHYALTAFSHLGERLGHGRFSEKTGQMALRLKKSFLSAFWVPRLRTFALALDGDGEACKVHSSNAGHVLLSDLPTAPMAREVAKNLLSDNLFSGWGIRTIGKSELRYDPVSYHNGSVWPHDNALILSGLARHRLSFEMENLCEGFLDGLRFFRDQRPPELYCGFDRKNGEGPFAYPTSCSPQAWSVTSLLMVLETMSGLSFQSGHPRMGRPILGPSLSSLHIEGIRLTGPTGGRANVFVDRQEDGIVRPVMEIRKE